MKKDTKQLHSRKMTLSEEPEKKVENVLNFLLSVVKIRGCRCLAECTEFRGNKISLPTK